MSAFYSFNIIDFEIDVICILFTSICNINYERYFEGGVKSRHVFFCDSIFKSPLEVESYGYHVVFEVYAIAFEEAQTFCSNIVVHIRRIQIYAFVKHIKFVSFPKLNRKICVEGRGNIILHKSLIHHIKMGELESLSQTVLEYLHGHVEEVLFVLHTVVSIMGQLHQTLPSLPALGQLVGTVSLEVELVVFEEHVVLIQVHLNSISLVQEEPPLVLGLDVGAEEVEVVVDGVRIEGFVCEKSLVKYFVDLILISLFEVLSKRVFKVI